MFIMEDLFLLNIPTRMYEPNYYDQYESQSSMFNGLSGFNLRSDILNCHSCPLDCYTKSVHSQNMNLPIMIIGSKPSDINFDTENGKVLKQLINMSEFNHHDIYRTSAVKCEESNDFIACHHYLISEIIISNPKIIITLGIDAGNQLFENLKNPGSMIKLPIGSDVLATYSLEEISQNVDNYNAAIDHFKLCKQQYDYLQQHNFQVQSNTV